MTNLYVKGETYVLAKDLYLNFFTLENTFTITKIFKGSDLVGLSYEPLYPYLKEATANDEAYADSRDKAFKVYGADFVTTTDGTGVVHTAVMYGQDDFELGTKLGLPKFHTVSVDGTFKESMDFLSGRFVKDEEVAIDIIKDLAHRGLLFKRKNTNTAIRTVGVVRPHLFIMRVILGIFVCHNFVTIWSMKTSLSIGSQHILEMVVLVNGSKISRTGRFPVNDTGDTTSNLGKTKW
jgi:hypothetical protein